MNVMKFRTMYENDIAGRLAYRLYDMAYITDSSMDNTLFNMLIMLSEFCPDDLVDDCDMLDIWNDIVDYFSYDFYPPSFFSEDELDELNCYIIHIGFEVEDIWDAIRYGTIG